mgnify:CR=1 FL=1
MCSHVHVHCCRPHVYMHVCTSQVDHCLGTLLVWELRQMGHLQPCSPAVNAKRPCCCTANAPSSTPVTKQYKWLVQSEQCQKIWITPGEMNAKRPCCCTANAPSSTPVTKQYKWLVQSEQCQKIWITPGAGVSKLIPPSKYTANHEDMPGRKRK